MDAVWKYKHNRQFWHVPLFNELFAHDFIADAIICAGTWTQIGDVIITSNSGLNHSAIALTSTTALSLQEGSTAFWDQQGNVQIYTRGNVTNGKTIFCAVSCTYSLSISRCVL